MQKLSKGIEKFFANCIPDALPLSFLLLLIIIAAALILTPSSIGDILGTMSSGFVSLWSFTMQVVFMMVAGYAMADAPLVQKGLRKLAHLCGEEPRRAIIISGIINNLIYYVSSSVGLVSGALLAKEMIRTNKKVNPAIVAVNLFCGFCNHCIGVTPAIFSTINTPGHQFEDLMGLIPWSQTSYWVPNIILSVIMIVGIPVLLALFNPKDFVNPKYEGDTVELQPELPSEDVRNSDLYGVETSRFVKFFESGKIYGTVLGVLTLIGVILWFTKRGGTLNFDTMAIIQLSLALILWGSIDKFGGSMKRGVLALSGVVISFPIYAAIMSVMTGTGLAQVISDAFVAISNKDTLPLFTYWSAGLVNVFVPSAGGQWVVQAPTVLPAAAEVGAGYNKIAAAVALGDCWTNLIQPFWALPMLGITGVKCREFLGYSAIVCIFLGIVTSLVIGFLYPIF